MALLPRVGDVFGRYRIDDEIGRGGMGVVFGATDSTLGRRVALKVVSLTLGGSEEFRLRFEREASVLARLDSPHVIAIYDYGTHAGSPYIATQYVGGGDLGVRLLEHGPLTPADALRVCAQTADALYDAHRVGVVHRDVKPTNVLLRDADDPDPHVYLCDFGIARTESEGLTATGAVAGTWSYLAPECGNGAPATPSSDIYAVGCLLWAALTGLPPYRGTDVQIAIAHQRSAVRQLPGGSPAIVAINEILARSMAKDPGARYRDADRLRAALLAAVSLPGAGVLVPPVPAGEPGTLPPAPPRPPTPTPTPLPHHAPAPHPDRPRDRRRGLVAALLVGAVLVVGGVSAVAVVALQDGPDGPVGPGTTEGVGTSTTDPTGESGTPPPPGPITGDLDGDRLGDISVDYDARDPEASLSTTWSSDGSTFVAPETDDLAPFGQQRGTWRLRGLLDDDDTADVLTFRQPERRGPVSVTGTLSGGDTIDTVLPGGSRPAETYDALGDLEGDGVSDLFTLEVVGPAPGTIVLSTWAFDGSTFGAAQERYEIGNIAQTYVRPGDVDGDGVTDLVTLVIADDVDADFNYPATLEVRLGDGAGGFAEPLTAPATFQSDQLFLRTGDFDGDGADEVLVGDEDLGFVVLGVFDLADGTVGSTLNAGSIRYDNVGRLGPDLAVSDVNGDGLDDVVSVGVIRPDGTGRMLVGVSNGSTFTTSRWLAWDQQFAEQDGEGRFEILEDARW